MVRLSGDADDDAVELFQIQKGNEGRLQTNNLASQNDLCGAPLGAFTTCEQAISPTLLRVAAQAAVC